MDVERPIARPITAAAFCASISLRAASCAGRPLLLIVCPLSPLVTERSGLHRRAPESAPAVPPTLNSLSSGCAPIQRICPLRISLLFSSTPPRPPPWQGCGRTTGDSSPVWAAKASAWLVALIPTLLQDWAKGQWQPRSGLAARNGNSLPGCPPGTFAKRGWGGRKFFVVQKAGYSGGDESKSGCIAT